MTDEELLEKALTWYQKGDPGYKAAALELFSKDVLDSKLEAFNKKVNDEFATNRDEELERVLEECKKKFPIGTLIWSDDYCDHLPNIVISEPYISVSEYHIPYDKYRYSFKGEKKTVICKTLRVYRNEILSGQCGGSIVGLETCLINTQKWKERGDTYWKNHFVDLEKFHKDEIEDKEKSIKNLQSWIKRDEESLAESKKELAGYEAYDPTLLTEDKVKKLVDDYFAQNGKIS